MVCALRGLETSPFFVLQEDIWVQLSHSSRCFLTFTYPVWYPPCQHNQASSHWHCWCTVRSLTHSVRKGLVKVCWYLLSQQYPLWDHLYITHDCMRLSKTHHLGFLASEGDFDHEHRRFQAFARLLEKVLDSEAHPGLSKLPSIPCDNLLPYFPIALAFENHRACFQHQLKLSRGHTCFINPSQYQVFSHKKQLSVIRPFFNILIQIMMQR